MKKGFTLIELLGVIVIIGLIIAGTAYGLIKLIDKSKEERTNISISSIKEAALVYANEKNNDEDYWNEMTRTGYEGKYFCVTIEELMINDSELQNNNEPIKNENLELFKNKLRPFFSEISYNTWIEDIKNIKVVNSKLVIHVTHDIVKSHLENHCFDTLLLNFNKMIDKNISELEILVE